MIKKLREQIKRGRERIKQIVTFNTKRRTTIKKLKSEQGATVMFDDVSVKLIPRNAPAVAGYVDGLYRTFPTLVRDFPNAWKVPIAVFASNNAECLDVERGDATPAEAPEWVRRQLKRGVKKPIIYTSASQVDYVLEILQHAGIKRSQVRVWSAHYTFHPHLCGPHSCGEVHSTTADATQWTDTALGRSLDQSLLRQGFFTP